MKADCVWLAALLEQTHSVWEQRAILHLLQICTVTFSGPTLENFENFQLGCFLFWQSPFQMLYAQHCAGNQNPTTCILLS